MRQAPVVCGCVLGWVILVAESAAQGNVIVVDDDGGPGVFLEIADAVKTAQDGDHILVRDGTYLRDINIGPRTVSIFADEGATVQINASINIARVPGRVVLRGLQGSTSNFDISNCPGDVWIEDCHFTDLSAIEGLKVFQSDVVFVRSSVEGVSQQPVGPSTYNSLAVLVDFASNVYFYDCVLTGGDGGDESIGIPALDGNVGLWMRGFAFVFASGCTIVGGDSLNEGGGAGMQITGSCSAVTVDSVFQGGTGDPDGPGITGPGIVTNLTPPARGFVASSPERHGDTGNVQIDGEPGDFVWVLHGLDLDAKYQANYQGAWLVDPTGLLTLKAGVLPGSGSLSLNYTVPTFAGFPVIEFFAQSLHFPLDGSRPVLGPGSVIEMLDPVY